MSQHRQDRRGDSGGSCFLGCDPLVLWCGQLCSMGKSFPGFSPTGPYLVTPDEFEDPGSLQLSCSVNGDVMQKASTADLIFSVPALIAELSAVLPLAPGDVIFTGTPEGVGAARKPPRYLQPGDELVSRIEGIGARSPAQFQRGCEQICARNAAQPPRWRGT
jgi:hypothetical protein